MYRSPTRRDGVGRRVDVLRARHGIDFVVVSFHHCAFSTTNAHASDGGVRDAWVPGGGKASGTVEWSRVRCTGFSLLAVEVEPGRHARMKVTALAESGERIDHFETGRG